MICSPDSPDKVSLKLPNVTQKHQLCAPASVFHLWWQRLVSVVTVGTAPPNVTASPSPHQKTWWIVWSVFVAVFALESAVPIGIGGGVMNARVSVRFHTPLLTTPRHLSHPSLRPPRAPC